MIFAQNTVNYNTTALWIYLNYILQKKRTGYIIIINQAHKSASINKIMRVYMREYIFECEDGEEYLITLHGITKINL